MLIEVRDAGPDDLPAVLDVAGVVDPPDEGADVDVAYYEHLLGAGRLVIAEAGGIVLGYSGVIDAGGATHLADLFVHPDAHGQGIGAALLEAVWDFDQGAPRQTFSSLHPAALPLYVRSGMTPHWPLLYLRGDPESWPSSPFVVRDADAAELAALEQGWIGWDRSVEYAYWSAHEGSRALVVSDGERPVAAGCVTRTRARHTLTHLSAVDASCLPDAVTALRPFCGSDLLVSVPGENPVLPLLLDLGWRVVDLDVYCASEPDLWDATRVLPHPGFV